MSKQENLQSRREFMRTACRCASIAVMAYLACIAMIRKKTRDASEPCAALNACRGCRIYDRCSLPQALSFKRRDEESNHG
ncbi:MAG: hypothetical protein JXR73_09010 [Candidatus Omnitrophica bacterium]|nr:hypothetical protein [Candidatus Omnitrophota bacterium]